MRKSETLDGPEATGQWSLLSKQGSGARTFRVLGVAEVRAPLLERSETKGAICTHCHLTAQRAGQGKHRGMGSVLHSLLIDAPTAQPNFPSSSSACDEFGTRVVSYECKIINLAGLPVFDTCASLSLE